MIVYLTRDIPAFVMYCVNGASRSSLLIESVDSMISTDLEDISIFKGLYGFRRHVVQSATPQISLDTRVFVFNPIGYPKVDQF